MFGRFRSPWWHVPLPWLTGEDAEDAALWREHLENRTRMGKAFEETDTPDWPWSSWTRFQGVALTSLTFGAWALSGASCAFALVVGSWRVRVAIAAYFCVTTVWKPSFRDAPYERVARLEAGAANGWRLLCDHEPGAIDCAKRPYLFCSHPHGLFCAGVSLNVVHSASALRRFNAKRVRLLVHPLLVNAFPLIKDWLRTLGQLPCDRATAFGALASGETCAIVPGGVREVVWAGRVDKERLYLSDVYGFARLAIQSGAPLVPTYTFGESLSMGPDWVPGFETRRKLSYLLNAPIMFVSLCQRWCAPFPNGRLVTAVGAPVDPGPIDDSPSRERVKALHTAYVDALLRMIERTKREAGYPTQETVIV